MSKNAKPVDKKNLNPTQKNTKYIKYTLKGGEKLMSLVENIEL